MAVKVTAKDIKESDLYEPVKLYLESKGYKVNGEIHSCDLVGQKGTELLVVELKKQLNLEVILQAAERQKIAEIVYIAVLKPANFKKNAKYKRICHLLRRLEIGLILVSLKKSSESKPLNAAVEVVQLAEAFDRLKSQTQNKKKRKRVENELLSRTAQTTGGISKTQVMTAYREQAILIAKELERQECCKPKDLSHLGLPVKKVQTILYSNHYGWFNRIDKGIYKISNVWISEREKYFTPRGSSDEKDEFKG